MSKDIEQAYATYRKIANKPATVANKGRNDPMIDWADASRLPGHVAKDQKQREFAPSEGKRDHEAAREAL